VAETPKDILLHSKEVKRYFVERCSALQVDPFVVARKAGMSVGKFSEWLNALDPDTMVDTVTQREVVDMFELLAVYPRVQFVIDEIDKLSESQMAIIKELQETKL
jgi:hypothetical protein